MAEAERKPIDQLVDLFVYAPVGLLYEYDEIVPRLVKRGKSQVALARFVGKMAMGRNPIDVDKSVNAVANVVARGITDIGSAIGLAPEADRVTEAQPREADTTPPPPAPMLPPPRPQDATDISGAEEAAAPQDEVADDVDVVEDESPPAQLPIARYDELTAKEIVRLLDDLDAGQLARIREHEQVNRARKTVLGKLDRLEG